MTGTAVTGRVDPGVIAAQLQEARARTFLLRCTAHRRGAPAPARSADESHPLGPRAYRAFRGALADPESRWADRVRRDAGPLQSLRAPPQRARRAGPAGPRPTAGTSWTRSAAGCLAVSPPPTSTRPIRCCTTATSTTWCSSTSTSTTRRCSRRCSSSRAGRTRRARGVRSAAGRPGCRPDTGEMVRFPGGPVEIGTDDRSAAYDNERPRARGRARALLDRRASGHQRRLSRFHGGRRLLDAGVLVGRRMELAARIRRVAPEVLAPGRRRWWTRARWTGAARSSRATRSATSATTKPRRLRASPASGCRPRSSGKPPRPGTPRPAPSARYPWGESRPTARSPTSTSSPSAPRRSARYPAQRVAHRLLRA